MSAPVGRRPRRQELKPLVSVGIPSYNHAPYLPAAIESVLGQTLRDVELVIADDGSTDGSIEIARRYADAYPDRVAVVTHPGDAHLGIGATGNLCRSRARGAYVVGLPSDDVLYPDMLEREVRFLESRPEIGFVYGFAHRIDASGRRIPRAWTFGSDITEGAAPVERLVQGNKIPAMTVMLRRECMEQAGPEDEAITYSDWEFFTRVAAHWEVGFLPRALAMHRVHQANTSFIVSRDVTLQRALEVTSVLRERAAQIGGRLAEPRVRALLELQLGYLRFASGEAGGAATSFAAAFERDGSLKREGRWLGDWVWERVLDGLLPTSGPSFAAWVREHVQHLLEPQAGRLFEPQAAAADGAERAMRFAREGRAARAHAAALTAFARSPRRLSDRRLPALLLETTGGGRPAEALLWARRHVRPRR